MNRIWSEGRVAGEFKHVTRIFFKIILGGYKYLSFGDNKLGYGVGQKI